MNGQLVTMVRVHLRTGWPALVVWVVAVGGTMMLTVSAIQGLYDTPEKIHSYAAAVRDDALVMLNGRIAGIDSLGGIIANEFGFLASFAIPFMAVSLIARTTRKNEEAGRLEAVLAGRISRTTPLLAAIVVAVVAEVLIAAALFASFAGGGVPGGDAVLYSLSMGALGLAFIGVASIAAQVVEHSRGVVAIGLGAIIAAYALRGIGDVQWAPLTWLSPLGWQEQTRAFGDQRWWPLLIPFVLFALLAAAALAVTSRRDIGSALLRVRAADPQASRFLRTPLGIALRSHRGSLLGWSMAAVVVAGTFGSVAKPLVRAINGNPSLASAMGGGEGATGLDSVLAMTALLLALICAGYAVQAVGVLRAEESSGRLEACLSGDRSRWSWLSVQLAVVGAGIVTVCVAGDVVFAFSGSASMGVDITAQVVRASIGFLPAVVFFGGLALFTFTVAPRWGSVVWLVYAAGAVIAYLGDSLHLATAFRDLSPFHLIGNPPVEPADVGNALLLTTLAAACLMGGYAGFRRRGIPHA
ncbi:ABC transporter permease [Kribbella sp. NPDC048928]|uniref:ABC transporter permease n=1 Tax=Kribbella sp. NPDC048928 TaxID=3364111 RepID=UPI00371D8FA6